MMGKEEEAQKEEADRVLTEVEAGWSRGALARANYLAQDRFDLTFAAKELCRRMAVPRRSDFVALRRLVRYVLEVPRLVQCFRWQEPTREFVVFTDTDFAGCPRARRSTNGGAILRGSHLIKHSSKTQKVVTLSSAEAELGGIVHGTTEGMGGGAVRGGRPRPHGQPDPPCRCPGGYWHMPEKRHWPSPPPRSRPALDPGTDP